MDGVGFLRRVNAGERPEMPETVVVVGGGDVAMDACRVAKRLPGCKHVKVIYRRGPGEIPARAIELHHAVKEDVEFLYHTQQVAVVPRGNQLALKCVKTALGEPDEDGRRRPVVIEGSEHEILCGSVIAAVGQRGLCEELDRAGMMGPDRVRAEWDSMRTSDPKVFAAGDGAFGGSTIVMAMQHGQRAAYYVRHFLEGNRDPLPYRTPYRTRRVPVAQDLMWEKFPIQEPEFCGLGERPAEFPEIELTYDTETARAEAARCYRCDAETGSADYSVQHREDIFSMARTDPGDAPKLKAMLERRLRLRENPFPEERPACLDDLVFLPANLSRLVIDPYREACKIGWRLGGRLALDLPFFVAGFDEASEELKVAVDGGVAAAGAAYLGTTRPGPDAPWLQLCEPGRDAPSPDAAGWCTGWASAGTRCRPRGRVTGRFSAFCSAHAAASRTPSSTRSSATSTCWCSTARGRSVRRVLSAESGRSSGPPRPRAGARHHRDAAPAEEGGDARHRLVRRRALGHRRGEARRLGGERDWLRGGGRARPRGRDNADGHALRAGPHRGGARERGGEHPQGQCGRGVDDGALRGQDPPTQHRAGGPALGHAGDRRGHGHPACRDAGGVACKLRSHAKRLLAVRAPSRYGARIRLAWTSAR